MARSAVLLVVVVLAACAPGAGAPGISERRAIIPEDRSACELLSRADLGVVATDPASLGRAADAVEAAADLVPTVLRPVFDRAAEAHRRAADGVIDATTLRDDPARTDLLEWQQLNCGHSN